MAQKNIFTGKFDNITNEDLSDYLGVTPDTRDLDGLMFDKIEQENIDFYTTVKRIKPAEARRMAAERKKQAKRNSGYEV